MASKEFTNLIVWQKAHELVLSVYKVTAGFPKSELYGLTSQFRRAAVSIPANIAEGYIKSGTADKMRFFNVSQGSLEECRYYCILSKDLGYGETKFLRKQIDEVGKILNSYMNTIKRSLTRGVGN